MSWYWILNFKSAVAGIPWNVKSVAANDATSILIVTLVLGVTDTTVTAWVTPGIPVTVIPAIIFKVLDRVNTVPSALLVTDLV